jgi:hypothetical protein
VGQQELEMDETEEGKSFTVKAASLEAESKVEEFDY